ncbi:MAG TPA: response regulator, partial [Opitutales bacterium]|nr:response regulator [Opitutales bacterium]
RGKYQDREKFPLPSLVFLDLHLAGRLGLEVLTWLRKQPHLDAIIVILLTASKEEEAISAAYEIGANSYLVKPPTVDSLKVLISALDQYEIELERNENL